MSDFETKVITYIEKKGFQPFNRSLLLAVSGGIDSVSMLHFWNTRGRKVFSCDISVAHVDHGLRPESGEDSSFLEKLCHDWNVPFHVKALDPVSKPSKISAEMWGRLERYKYFEELQRTGNYDWVLTAHNCDDQLETILLRIMRKSGLRGLQGIHFFREPGIVRPFLNLSREMIEEYAGLNELIWKEDPSNRDISIPRNEVRHKIIPQLKGSDPGILQSVSRLSGDVQFLWPQVEKGLFRSIKVTEDNNTSVSIEELKPLMDNDDESVFHILMMMAQNQGVYFPESSLLEFFRQWQINPDSIRVSISSNVEILSKNGSLQLVGKQLDKKEKNSKYGPVDVGLEKPGKPLKFRWEEREFLFIYKRYEKPEKFKIPRQKSLKAIFDGNELNKVLTIRNRRDGDRFSPLGTHSTSRKLKVYLNGLKYPVEERDSQMLICFQQDIVWIPGLEISDFFKVGPHTREIIEMEIKWLE